MKNLEPLMLRLLSRRGALALLGAGSALTLGALAKRSRAQGTGALPACIVRPEQTEGPFFVEEKLNRSAIRSDPASGAAKTGAPLRVTFKVSRVTGSTCAPLAGAEVHVWHCDAAGAYSDVRDPHGSTVGQKFLRGYQVTDANGLATFTTIYPGWYEGRAVHIHFKVRTAEQTKRGRDFTSQIYFDDALNDKILARAPYTTRGRRDVRNDQDGLFRRGGTRLLLPVREEAGVYAGTFEVGLSA
jgi:protocatechuate 3,4-dioxygenase beta subunit